MKIRLHDVHATEVVAEKLATLCVQGDCVALHGDIGAGKTTFARAFIQRLQKEKSDVLSPTFTLVYPYQVRTPSGDIMLYHYDLYRIEKEEELDEIGLEESLEDGLGLIEWPEIARAYLPADTLHLYLEEDRVNGGRMLHAQYHQGWQKRVEEWEGHVRAAAE